MFRATLACNSRVFCSVQKIRSTNLDRKTKYAGCELRKRPDQAAWPQSYEGTFYPRQRDGAPDVQAGLVKNPFGPVRELATEPAHRRAHPAGVALSDVCLVGQGTGQYLQ